MTHEERIDFLKLKSKLYGISVLNLSCYYCKIKFDAFCMEDDKPIYNITYPYDSNDICLDYYKNIESMFNANDFSRCCDNFVWFL